MARGRKTAWTKEQLEQRKETKNRRLNLFQKAIGEALAKTKDGAFITFQEFHTNLNALMRSPEYLGDKNYDAEFIEIGNGMAEFEKSHKVQYKNERYGKYQSQTKTWLRLQQEGNND